MFWFSLLISVITVATMQLAARKRWEAWALGLFNQALWVVFIVWTGAYGLLVLTSALTITYTQALVRWRRDLKPEPEAEPLPVTKIRDIYNGNRPLDPLAGRQPLVRVQGKRHRLATPTGSALVVDLDSAGITVQIHPGPNMRYTEFIGLPEGSDVTITGEPRRLATGELVLDVIEWEVSK